MTKATEAALTLFALSSVYFAFYSGLFPSSVKFHDEILPYLPWWTLVTFGSYSLGTLGWDVLTFNDKEEKYQELMEQVQEAKEFYKTNGLVIE